MKKISLVALIVSVSYFMLPGAVRAAWVDYPMMGGFGQGWWWGGGMVIGMIVFWSLAVWLIFGLVRWLISQNQGNDSAADSALEILKARYAKGEISKKEFVEKKKDLM